MHREVDDLARRARQVNGAIVHAGLFPETLDMWNSSDDHRPDSRDNTYNPTPR